MAEVNRPLPLSQLASSFQLHSYPKHHMNNHRHLHLCLSNPDKTHYSSQEEEEGEEKRKKTKHPHIRFGPSSPPLPPPYIYIYCLAPQQHQPPQHQTISSYIIKQVQSKRKMPATPSKSSVQLQRINGSMQAMTCHRQLHAPPPAARKPYTPRSLPDLAVDDHTHLIGANQCCSAVVQTVAAPADAVWAVVRRFDRPQAYKHFVKSCRVVAGGGDVGSLREVRVVSGLPAISSTERLEMLDDVRHVMSFSVVGGDHRLANYRSVTSLHPSPAGGTVVVESYVVDIPPGNSWDDTRVFVDTIVRCNLQSLAQIAMAAGSSSKPSSL